MSAERFLMRLSIIEKRICGQKRKKPMAIQKELIISLNGLMIPSVPMNSAGEETITAEGINAPMRIESSKPPKKMDLLSVTFL